LDIDTCCGCANCIAHKEGEGGKHCVQRSQLNCKQQWCVLFSMLFLCYLIFGSILQWICFHWSTQKCGSGSPADDYAFPGGGLGKFGNASFELLPRHAILVERVPLWYASAFDVFNASDADTQKEKVGTWFRTWGPFFSTYTYQDISASNQPTIYMRKSWQSILFKYNDDYAMRCDGKGEVVRVSEGSKIIGNRIRNAFKMNQGFMFSIFVGGQKVGFAEESHFGIKSIQFNNATDGTVAASFANSQMMSTERIGDNGARLGQWQVTNNFDSSVAFWQVNAISVLYAFRVHDIPDVAPQGVPTSRPR